MLDSLEDADKGSESSESVSERYGEAGSEAKASTREDMLQTPRQRRLLLVSAQGSKDDPPDI